MAIIENTPQTKKIDQEDLDRIAAYRESLTNFTYKRGNFGIAEDNLNKQKEQLVKELDQLAEEEIQISKLITEKYGTGEIDLESGTITLPE